VADAQGNSLAADFSFEFTTYAVAAGRYVFYNNSAYDGGNAAITFGDGIAIAPDKQALRPGETASFSNVTSYSRGLNGIIVDLAGLPASRTPTLADFDFRVGTGGDSAAWPAAPAPSGFLFLRGGGSINNTALDRVFLTWADGAIRDRWLQVTVKANDNTRLAAPDVFYFGNLAGETGDRPAALAVSAMDLARTLRATSSSPAGLTSRFDFNRDRKVNALDRVIVRQAMLKSLAALTAPPVASLAAPVPPSRARSILGDDAAQSPLE
jgi:hypothetical protein